MHKETFPHLYNTFPVANFENIIEVLNRDYADLYPLMIMDQFYKEKGASQAYSDFFEATFNAAKEKYTDEEIRAAVFEALKNHTSAICSKPFFFPILSSGVPKPLGFIEKLATGDLSAAEPLSYIDMLRATHWFQTKSTSYYHGRVSYVVLPLANVTAINVSGKVSIINLQSDPQQTPKWIVLDSRTSKPLVFCEAPLLESEKMLIEQQSGLTIPGANYQGGKAALSISTGYTALAWCMENIDRVCALTLESDFAALVEEFIYLQAITIDKSYNNYLSSDYKRFVGASLSLGNRTYSFARATVLGQFGEARYKPNDLCAALKPYLDARFDAATRQTSLNARTYILGFDAALSDAGYINEYETEKLVRLSVPEVLSVKEIDTIRSSYRKFAGKYSVGASWLQSHVMRDSASQDNSVAISYATAMVLAVFRSRAKMANLDISLPQSYQLDAIETGFIEQFMQNNPYVCQLTLSVKNTSMQKLKHTLLPIFARNRWLAENSYKPPMFDDYWKKAAYFWMLHLVQTPEVLLDLKENQLFKNCVTEMGLEGLKSVLGFLTNEVDRAWVEKLYGKERPPFYLNCNPEQMGAYLDLLLGHLQHYAYFPFAQLGISFSEKNAKQIERLIAAVNTLDSFDAITLTDCLSIKKATAEFLGWLSLKAHDLKWTSLIIIPELHDKENVSEALVEIRSAYAHLNNIILNNIREKKAQEDLRRIEELSNFSDSYTVQPSGSKKSTAYESIDFDRLLSSLAQRSGSNEWRIQRGGEVQLQLQQQQQIQQARQLQQEQQRMNVHQVEEAFFEGLISYGNIEERMSGFLESYQQDHEVNALYASKKNASESLLQGFFHTWIDANPAVKAKHTIRFMTKDAVVELLKHHRLMVSGVKLNNLPRGFFLQRSKDSDYILSFKADMDYVTPPNARTLRLNVRIPELEYWEGDFRQFAVDSYIGLKENFSNQDWLFMAIFSSLQPECDYTEDYEDFLQINPHLAQKLGQPKSGLVSSFLGGSGLDSSNTVRKNAIKHWPIVLQAWQYAGEAGIDQYLLQNEWDFDLNPDDIKAFLMRDVRKDLQSFVERYPMKMAQLRAIGQVYYRFGTKGLTVLYSKLLQMEQRLGQDFYNTFFQAVLSRCKNYNAFINEEFFVAMDAMIGQLSGHQNAGALDVWKNIIAKHYNATNWDNITHLWNAFSNFNQELARSGLHLDGQAFDEVAAGNMIVYMDKVIECIAYTPNFEKQESLLNNLSQWDMSNGGLPYAIVHEKFRNFDKSLLLHDFTKGTPTYAPNLASLFKWNESDAPLQIQRSLASLSQISRENFLWVKDQLAAPSIENRNVLVMLAHTKFAASDIKALVAQFNELPFSITNAIRHYMHRAIYKNGYQQLSVHWAAINRIPTLDSTSLLRLLDNDNNVLLLESLSLLHIKDALSQQNLDALCDLFERLQKGGVDFTKYHARMTFKLAVIFAVESSPLLQRLMDVLEGSKPIVQQEVRLLFRHLMSVDIAASAALVLNDKSNWNVLIEGLETMDADPGNTAFHRSAIIENLSAKGIVFTFSKGGHYRALGEKAEDGPDSLRFFIDHEDRLWNFLQKHVAVKVDENPQEQLAPIINFLKQLQLNVTYLNEVEPLLSVLETTKNGMYWSTDYLNDMFRALTPEDEKSAFPIGLLKILLQEQALKACPIDEIGADFPQAITDVLRIIQANTVFTRSSQAVLSQIALREYHWSGSTDLLVRILGTLAGESFSHCRSSALSIMSKCRDKVELEQCYESCRAFMILPVAEDPHIHQLWPETIELWLDQMGSNDTVKTLHQQINIMYSKEPVRQMQVLFIVAWSSLEQGLKNHKVHRHELSRKAPKLIEALATLSSESMQRLIENYPNQPCPSASDILRIIKESDKENATFEDGLTTFEKQPFSEPRSDYHPLAITRQADLERMLKEVQIGFGAHCPELSLAQSTRITLVFTYLKQLESGQQGIKGCDYPISQMSQAEIEINFKTLSMQLVTNPDSDLLKAQVCALMFEAMGRSTRKYPHLAQQFALIANDLLVTANSRVLQLSVGEGKSHYVAMQAARYAAQGKCVDVCTAKRSLALRDREDYKDFFHYLGLSTTDISPKSAHETYQKNAIHYTTLGDLSLFLDEQNYAGTPIDVAPENRVGLFDEFDFTRFEEGRKTEYNFAKPTGYTPKQLIWFYQSINRFYDRYQQEMLEDGKGIINVACLQTFAGFLVEQAGDLEQRQNYVARFIADPLKMVQYLQSAHEAAKLQRGVNFTVQDKIITIGDEQYPMREVVPLSSDNQRMSGSTFSAGVHQLLAVRLNSQAQISSEPQNFHVHPESNILSSQVAAFHMQSLWGKREGFSGTISDVQKQRLYRDEQTVVLHAPTNRAVQRKWHPALFLQDEDTRADVLVEQLKIGLEKNHSVLVCCKNDKQVELFNRLLQQRLSSSQLEQLLFYTNEDPRSAQQVLADKKEMEYGEADSKTRGVALVASGFGRGDNTGTEAVFVLGTRDFSDLTQKGGRTARNGTEGEVFQFYLSDELRVEEELYLRRLKDGTRVLQQSLQTLQKAFPDDDDASVLNRLLILREYCFELDNIVNESYHHALAQYSGWGMQRLASIDDPIVRQELTEVFSASLRLMEKTWIQVEATDVDAATKQEALLDGFKEEAGSFLEAFTAKTEKNTKAFVMRAPPKPMLKLSIPESPKQREYSPDKSSIFISLSNLPAIDWTDARLYTLPEKLEAMSGESHLIRFIASKMRHATSAKAFLDGFDLMYEAFANPSESWSAELVGAFEKTLEAHVPQKIFDDRHGFMRLMSEMHRNIQEPVSQYLSEGHTATVNSRANRLKPVLQYLSGFTPVEQRLWGATYISHVDIIHDQYADVIAIAPQLPAMPFTHLKLFSDLIRRYPDPYSLGNVTLMERLHRLTVKHPQMQIRILTRCEALVAQLDSTIASEMFHNLVLVIVQHIEHNAWPVADRLLVNSAASNVAYDALYNDVFELWRVLAMHADHLANLQPLLNFASNLTGKPWYSLPLLCFEKATIQQNIDFQTTWVQIWKAIYPLPGKLQTKQQGFVSFMEHLRDRSSEAVIQSQYTQLLLRCYEQIATTMPSSEAVQNRLKVLFDVCNQYEIEETTEFLHCFDALYEKNAGYELLPLHVVNLYDYCRKASINHAHACHEDFQTVVQTWFKEQQDKDTLSEPPIASIQGMVRTLSHISPRLCREIFDDLKKVSCGNLSASEAIALLDICLMEGMDESLFYRHQKTLISYWERLDASVDRSQAMQAFKTHIQRLVEFDSAILSKNMQHPDFHNLNSEQQCNQILGDVFDFKAGSQDQATRVWRMRFLVDGVLIQAQTREDEPYKWTQTKNTQLLNEAFDKYASEMQTTFGYPVAQKLPTQSQQIKAHQKALILAEEMRFIGNSNSLDFTRVKDEENHLLSQAAKNSLFMDLKSELKPYENRWFKASSRVDQIRSLSGKINLLVGYNTYPSSYPNTTSLKDILRVLQRTKLEAMESDLRLNKTRWFSLNRNGRSRYYETLNHLQTIVMKHCSNQGYEKENRFTSQGFFQFMPEYQSFFKDDLMLHCSFLRKSLQPYLEKEHYYQPYFYEHYHAKKLACVEALLSRIDTILLEKDDALLSFEAVRQLQKELKNTEGYLPGELKVFLREALYRCEAIPDPSLIGSSDVNMQERSQ